MVLVNHDLYVLNVKSKVWYTRAYVTGGYATDVAVIKFGLKTNLKVQYYWLNMFENKHNDQRKLLLYIVSAQTERKSILFSLINIHTSSLELPMNYHDMGPIKCWFYKKDWTTICKGHRIVAMYIILSRITFKFFRSNMFCFIQLYF